MIFISLCARRTEDSRNCGVKLFGDDKILVCQKFSKKQSEKIQSRAKKRIDEKHAVNCEEDFKVQGQDSIDDDVKES